MADTEKHPFVSIERADHDIPSPQVHKKRRFWEKLGVYNIVVLIVGTAAAFLAVAFLAFLWAASQRAIRHGSFSPLWRVIVENDFTSRVVTVCSVIVRLATAAQLGVFAAIMAALILERVGASTQDFPLLSMIRCSNTGPQSLIWNVVHTVPTGTQLGYSFIIVLAILNAFALQFSSTILLADFHSEIIVMDRFQQRLAFGFDSNGLGDTNTYTGTDFWKQGPATYPSFAEYKESQSKGLTYVDTGKTYRAFLPFRASNDRMMLQEYAGPMTIVDTRVVCVKPTFSNLTIYEDSEPTPSVAGNITFKNTHPAVREGWEDGYPFNCSLPVRDFTAAGGSLWDASLCTFGVHVGRLLDGIVPDDDTSMPTGHTSAHLWLNASTHDKRLNNSVMYPPLGSLVPVESSNGAWARFGGENVTFDASLCFINPMPSDYNGVIQSFGNTSDVFLGYDSKNRTYDAASILRMLGITDGSLTLQERGLFQLKPVANWTAKQTSTVYNISTSNYIGELAGKLQTGDEDAKMGASVSFVPYSTATDSIHRFHIQVVQRILRMTSNPAFALQAINTILLQMAYYDFFPQFDALAHATWTSKALVTVPSSWRAFTSILALLGLHFFLVSVALMLFFTRTEMSLLGNSWQAVSQVMSTDTADAVRHGATSTDSEVKDSVKESGIAEDKIVIAKSESSGRAEATFMLRRR